MKKILLVLLLLYPNILLADPWDNLTLQQAKQVEAFLNSNPYVLDYCDCCDFEGKYATKIELIKVKSTKIVTWDWGPEYLSVEAKVEVLAEIPYTKGGPDINSPILDLSERELPTTITMNYTWAYNKEKGRAAPLYTFIPYDVEAGLELDSGYCRQFTTFPPPKAIKNKEYEKWFNKRFPTAREVFSTLFQPFSFVPLHNVIYNVILHVSQEHHGN